MWTKSNRILSLFAVSLALLICSMLLLSGGPVAAKGKPPKPDDGGDDAISYTITDLGLNTIPYDINNAGQVVGVDSQEGGSPRALLWQVDADGNIQDTIFLGTLPGFIASGATAISDLGEVVGSLRTAASLGPAFYLKPIDVDGDGLLDWYADADGDGGNDLMIDLGTLPGGDLSQAVAINERGQIAGWSRKEAGGPWFPVLWQVDAGGNVVIKEMPNGSDINNFGQLVGGSGVSQLDANGDVVETHDLGTLLPPEIDAGHGATAINDSAEVVGALCENDGSHFGCMNHGFIVRPLDGDGDGTPDTWFLDENGDGLNDLMVALSSIETGVVNSPNDINELGQVVGIIHKGNHAFLWQNDVMTDLHQLVPRKLEWNVREAMAISDLGQIVGQGWLGKRSNKLPHGWLLTPK